MFGMKKDMLIKKRHTRGKLHSVILPLACGKAPDAANTNKILWIRPISFITK